MVPDQPSMDLKPIYDAMAQQTAESWTSPQSPQPIWDDDEPTRKRLNAHRVETERGGPITTDILFAKAMSRAQAEGQMNAIKSAAYMGALAKLQNAPIAIDNSNFNVGIGSATPDAWERAEPQPSPAPKKGAGSIHTTGREWGLLIAGIALHLALAAAAPTVWHWYTDSATTAPQAEDEHFRGAITLPR